MTSRIRTLLKLSLTIGALFAAGSCSDSPTAPQRPTAEAAPNNGLLGDLLGGLLGGGTHQLIACPSTETQTTTATLGILGGTLSLGGTKVVIPYGALLGATTVTLTIPASQYMEIDVSVPGEEHFFFERRVTVTVDYSRCDPANTSGYLTAWYIDSNTKELLERMMSVDNKLTRSVTFYTYHLSGYALAD